MFCNLPVSEHGDWCEPQFHVLLEKRQPGNNEQEADNERNLLAHNHRPAERSTEVTRRNQK